MPFLRAALIKKKLEQESRPEPEEPELLPPVIVVVDEPAEPEEPEPVNEPETEPAEPETVSEVVTEPEESEQTEEPITEPEEPEPETEPVVESEALTETEEPTAELEESKPVDEPVDEPAEAEPVDETISEPVESEQDSEEIDESEEPAPEQEPESEHEDPAPVDESDDKSEAFANLPAEILEAVSDDIDSEPEAEPESEPEPEPEPEPESEPELDKPNKDYSGANLNYDFTSGERYVDSVSTKTEFDKMLDELSAISKDLLSWQVEKFARQHTGKFQGDFDKAESDAKKYEAFLGGYITNAAMTLCDNGYTDAAMKQLDQAKRIIESRLKLEAETQAIKARVEEAEDTVDLTDILGLFGD